MYYNCFLALLAVLFGIIFMNTKNRLLKYAFGLLWLLFLPNTIYMITDIVHLIHEWGRVTPMVKGILIVQFAIIEIVALVTYIIGLEPFERILDTYKLSKHTRTWALIGFHFIIAFGMVLGRIERINSWDIFTHPVSVFSSVLTTATSLRHLSLFILLGLFCNLFYFVFRDPIMKLFVGRKKRN